MSAPAPTILPTRGTEVATAALAGGSLAFLVFTGVVRFGQSLPVLGPAAWLSIAVCAAWTGRLAVVTRAALHQRRESLEPRTAVTRLLLGKTSLLAGTFLGAAYLGLIGVAVGGWPAPLARERVLHGGIAVVACAAWAVLGWLLERACRIPPDDDTPPDTRGGDGPVEGPEVP